MYFRHLWLNRYHSEVIDKALFIYPTIYFNLIRDMRRHAVPVRLVTYHNISKIANLGVQVQVVSRGAWGRGPLGASEYPMHS